VIKLLSWNIAHRDVWADLTSARVDVAMLQEVGAPPTGIDTEIIPGGEGSLWRTAGWERCDWRTAIVQLSDAVRLTPRPTVPLHETTGNADFGVSREGTITAADVIFEGRTLFTAVSVYAKWSDRSAATNRAGQTAPHTDCSPTSRHCCGTSVVIP
jgi:hypothetical protein